MKISIEVPKEVAPIFADYIYGSLSLISVKSRHGIRVAVQCIELKNELISQLKSEVVMVAEGI